MTIKVSNAKMLMVCDVQVGDSELTDVKFDGKDLEEPDEEFDKWLKDNGHRDLLLSELKSTFEQLSKSAS